MTQYMDIKAAPKTRLEYFNRVNNNHQARVISLIIHKKKIEVKYV